MSTSSMPLASEPLDHLDDGARGPAGDHRDPRAAVIERDLLRLAPLRRHARGQRRRAFDRDGGSGQGALLNLARRADGDDAALVDDGHAVAELLGLLDVVGGEQDGALLAAEVLHQLVNLQARLRIEAGRRLVEEQHLRIVEEREGQRQALLLAAGKLRIQRLALFPELQALEELAAVDGARVEAREKVHGLADLHLVLEPRGLEADADAVLHLAGLHLRIEAEHRHPAAGARAKPLEDFDRGGFSGAVRPEQSEHFAGAHVEVDALHRGKRAIVFAETFDLDGPFHCGIRPGQAAGCFRKKVY